VTINLSKPIIRLKDAVGQRLEGAQFDSMSATLVFDGGVVLIELESEWDGHYMQEKGEPAGHIHDLVVLGVISQADADAHHKAVKEKHEADRVDYERKQYEALRKKFEK
jgi:hypothetical protein